LPAPEGPVVDRAPHSPAHAPLQAAQEPVIHSSTLHGIARHQQFSRARKKAVTFSAPRHPKTPPRTPCFAPVVNANHPRTQANRAEKVKATPNSEPPLCMILSIEIIMKQARPNTKRPNVHNILLKEKLYYTHILFSRFIVF